jgi:UDP-glucuronate 4-epimerase
MNILLTGGSGFIGSTLADFLLTAGHSIINLDDFNDFYDPKIKRSYIQKALRHKNYTLIEGNILDETLVKNAIKTHNIDTIIHLAARAGVRPSIEQPMLYQKTNIEGTLVLLEAARHANIKKFLFASSSSVYGNNEKTPFSETDNVDNPISPYAATKKAGELLCSNYHHLYNIPIACLRFFTVYGPRQRPEMAIHKFTRMIDEGIPIPVFNNGKCLRDYTYVEDIVRGIDNILNSDSLTFDIVNLGESDTISTLDLIRLIEESLGKKAILNCLPAQAGDVEKTFADISHAKKTYNYNPTTKIQNGVPLFIDWYRKNKT